MPKLGPWRGELERMLEVNETKARRERLTLHGGYLREASRV